jgi:hypothetical protein
MSKRCTLDVAGGLGGLPKGSTWEDAFNFACEKYNVYTGFYDKIDLKTKVHTIYWTIAKENSGEHQEYLFSGDKYDKICEGPGDYNFDYLYKFTIKALLESNEKTTKSKTASTKPKRGRPKKEVVIEQPKRKGRPRKNSVV